MKYLELYESWMKTGRVQRMHGTAILGGLCGSVLMYDRNFRELFDYGQDVMSFWAADAIIGSERVHAFGPTRQNIVLLLAAMNNEL